MQHKPKLVAILNVTPDSFSDGGKYHDGNAIITRVQKLITDGADIIDIGAESTRPGATPLEAAEEWQRLAPILPQICALAKSEHIFTSIDTRHASTAHNAIKSGIDWVNDVSGANSAQMVKILSSWPGKIVVMHNLGIPADKNITISEQEDAVTIVKQYLQSAINRLQQQNINKNRIIIDPGIGFGKTSQQSWQMLQNIKQFQDIGAEILIGHSRKSFLVPNSATINIAERDEATVTISKQLAADGVDYLRVHNVALHRKMLDGYIC